MKRMTCTTTILVTLVLAACGSGGSGSGVSSSGNSSISVVTLPPVASPSDSSVSYFTMTGGNKEQTLSFDEANIKTVIIGGEKLDIGSYKAGFNNQWVMQAGGVSAGSNEHNGFTPQSIYAYTEQADYIVGMLMKDNVWYAFYNGKPTDVANMPNSGIAQYKGGATLESGWGAGTGSSFSSLMPAGTDISVDFGNKKLTGSIARSDRDGGAIQLNANVIGNSFKSSSEASVQTKGQFFGSNAEQLGGVFKEASTYAVGAFYGVKQ